MDKFEPFKPDEETIESWLDAFEARLLCHNVQACERKRHWCQALVGEAGRNIIKKLPARTTWDVVKRELIGVLGESNPKDRAFEKLLNYKPGDKGLGEMATDIMTKAIKAIDDEDSQHRLGLRAFFSAVPNNLGKELRRKHFNSVKEDLEEARFLQRVEDEENSKNDKVLVVDKEDPPSQKDIIEECIKQLQAKGLLAEKKERPGGRFKPSCWCCGEEGHFLMQCPIIVKNRTAQFKTGTGPKTQGNE